MTLILPSGHGRNAVVIFSAEEFETSATCESLLRVLRVACIRREFAQGLTASSSWDPRPAGQLGWRQVCARELRARRIGGSAVLR